MIIAKFVVLTAQIFILGRFLLTICHDVLVVYGIGVHATCRKDSADDVRGGMAASSRSAVLVADFVGCGDP